MSISLFVNKYLDCFHLYTIMNNPTINILIQVVLWMCIFISLRKNQGMELLNRKVSICLTRKFLNHFPKWLFHFISLYSILYTWLCHLWIKTVLLSFWLWIILFSWLITLACASSTMLIEMVRVDILDLFSVLRGETFSFSITNLMPFVFFIDSLYQFEEVFYYLFAETWLS